MLSLQRPLKSEINGADIYCDDGGVTGQADVRGLIDAARQQGAQTANSALSLLYWHVGQRIRRELQQDGGAEHGERILPTLSAKLARDRSQGGNRPSAHGRANDARTRVPRSLHANFLGLPQDDSERDLEDAIMREMERFLLEQGVGFTLIARQQRISVGADDFYP